MKLKPIFKPVHEAALRRTTRNSTARKLTQAGKAADHLSYTQAIVKPARPKVDLAQAFGRVLLRDKTLLDESAAHSKEVIQSTSEDIQQASDDYALAKQDANERIVSSYEGPHEYVDHAVGATYAMTDVLANFYSGVQDATLRFDGVRFLAAVVIEADEPETLSHLLKALHKKFVTVGKVLVNDTKTLQRAWTETTRWRRDLITVSQGSPSDWRTFSLPFTGLDERRTLIVEPELTRDLIGVTTLWQETINNLLTDLHKPRRKSYNNNDSDSDDAPTPPLREQVANARGHVMDLKRRIAKRRSRTLAVPISDK